VALKAMGEDGYMKIAKQLMDTTVRLKTELSKIPVREM
jgi:glutamate/tyrosine decarboxylase-like PLP-dependent enzyme